MNFKSYIDAIKYKKMGNESCFIIGGWGFSVSGEKVSGFDKWESSEI